MAETQFGTGLFAFRLDAVIWQMTTYSLVVVADMSWQNFMLLTFTSMKEY